jgi:adenine phosphoribosyltransferase
MNLKDYIALVEDYPKKGIKFRDITPLLANGKAFNYATDEIVKYAKEKNIDIVVGPEARGFIFGCPVSYALEVTGANPTSSA